MNGDCVFCQIVRGDIEAFRIWEDKEFLAILDSNPNVRGMALVMTKHHYPSYVFELPEDIYERFLAASREVALLLDRKLPVYRTAMVMEGMGINHAHIKLYPLHGLKEKFEKRWAQKRVHFDSYQGYVSTQLGPKADADNLRKLAELLRD